MADDPEHEPGEPKPQPECQHGGERADQDGGGPGRPTEQNGLGKRAVEHKLETIWPHQISAPPPNEKNERKKELAAKAIDRPKTTWTIMRNPPEVSPKASDMP